MNLYVTTGFLAFFVATTLAIDVGMLTTARGQSQNAADAGALAGAIALALDSFDDRSAGGPAVQAAASAARENTVIGVAVAVDPSDVTFPTAPTAPDGEPNRVRVAVHRTSARDNPLETFISAVFGVTSVDMTAAATAEAAPANAITCVRPFTIPDRWAENNVPPNDTFDRYDNKGDVMPDADVYAQGVNSYDPERDKGLRLTLRAGTGNNIAPSFYYSWAMPGADGETGADWYRENIRQCNQAVFVNGSMMTQEPGNMVGPTIQGVEDLIAQDPTAYWDPVAGVVSPQGLNSPRIKIVPLYDPNYIAQIMGGNHTLTFNNFALIFVQGVQQQGPDEFVIGRFMYYAQGIGTTPGAGPPGSLVRVLQLVE